MHSGEFFNLSREIQNRLIRRLKILFKRIERLAGKQVLRWAGAAMALILTGFVAHAQFNDPVAVSGFNTGYKPVSAFVDLDDDGDMDIIIGNYDGTVYYVQNDDDVYSRVSNPFSAIDVGYYAAPAAVDLDEDGDFDLVVGNWDGTFAYFENNGGTFTEQTGMDNPFDAIDLLWASYPVFIDIDDDDDLDLVSGDYHGIINCFENDGGVFTQLTGLDNPFDVVSIPSVYMTSPTFADFDGDEDLDLFIGEYDGTIFYYRNINGVYTEQTGINNPFDGIDVGWDSSPSLWDADYDGDLDMIIGDYYSQVLRFFRNDGNTYSEKRGEPNPFEGLLGYLEVAPAFADIDEDGDLDLVLGDAHGDLNFFENTDEGLELRLAEEDNPFYGYVVNQFAKPAFSDVDDDGDLDLVVGDYYGALHYYANDNGDFFEITGINDPFNGILVPFATAPTFADVDNDGDEDLVVGSYYGTPDKVGRISYFRNVSGEFIEQTGVDNPFQFINDEANSSLLHPTFADIDRDGDMDLYIGDKYSGTIRLFENNGGAFAEVTGSGNPFDGIVFNYGPVPDFADVDDDGDLDLYVGTFNKYNGGRVYFIESTQGPDIDAISPEIVKDLISIYSNDHTIFIDGGSNILDQVEVYTVSGELLTSEIINQSGRYELYLPSATPGIYIVRTFSNGEPTVKLVDIR
jgi:hypothetical protein